MAQINRTTSNTNWSSLLVVNTGQIIEADQHLLQVIDFLDSVPFFLDDDMPLAEALAGTATTPRLIAADKLLASINQNANGSIDLHSDVDTSTTAPTTGQVLKWNGSAWTPQADLSGGAAGPIDDLTDVDTTTAAPTNGQVLKWDGTNWTPQNEAGGASAIDDLSDVDTSTTAPTSGQVLAWDGTNWVPTTTSGGPANTDALAEGATNLYYTDARVTANTSVAANTAKLSADGSIDTHSDVDTTTTAPTAGQYLSWDGTNWVPATAAGGANAIDDLSDVDTSTTAPTTGQYLSWDGTNWVPASLGSVDLHSDVDTSTTAPVTGQVLEWDGTNWIPATPAEIELWYTTEAAYETAQPEVSTSEGDLAFVGGAESNGFKIFGTNTDGTRREQRVARINLTTTGNVDASNPFGNEYNDGAGGAITTVTTFNVQNIEKGGRMVIDYQNATAPTITGATLYSSSQAFVPSARTHIIFNIVGNTAFYHFIEI